MHGFSSKLLAHAWDVTEEDVEKLLNAQESAGFVKLEEEAEFMKLPEPENQNGFFGEFVFRVKDSQPEISVKKGGLLSLVNALQLPILKQLNLAFGLVRLQPGALIAPYFTTNSPSLLYVTEGRGRIEIAYPDGGVALRTNVTEGDVIIIPSGFPAAQHADENSIFEWAAFSGSSLPIPSFLAGANSLYKSFPLPLLTSAFNVDKELEEKFRSRRTKDFIIFPAREKKGESEKGEGEAELRVGKWVEKEKDGLKNFLENARNAIKEDIGLRLPSDKDA